MERPAKIRLRPEAQPPAVALSGDWTSDGLGEAGRELGQVVAGGEALSLDLTRLGRLDTAGAYAIVRAADAALSEGRVIARPETLRLLNLVSEASHKEPAPLPRPKAFQDLTVRVGKGVIDLGVDAFETLVFAGHLLVVTGLSIVNPRRLRWASIITQAERAGLDAMPIVAVTSFFIGAVVALLGANMLMQFGASVFVVELIGIAVLREFAIVITAVLLAGRSASSFAAEIGAMKMTQEIDAMKVLGVDPFEALVLPRFAALLMIIPLLTFIASLAGLLGGLLVTWSVLDLGPAFFLQRIRDNVGAQQFWIGMSKAPVMAIVIAGIGCRQGMEVGGDVQSLGKRVTASVVHAIFAIILIDAIFALIYMEMDL